MLLVDVLGRIYPFRMRLLLPASLLVFIVFISLGCTPKGSPVVEGSRTLQPREAHADMDWPAWHPHAVDVRTHPASRYVKKDDQLQLEARVELLDQFNEPTKDVGQLKIELRLLDANGQVVRDDQGRQRGFWWDYDLRTPEQQQLHWDPIARAYIFGLKISPEEKDLLEYRTVLRVTFDPAWPGKPTLPTGERSRKPLEIRAEW